MSTARLPDYASSGLPKPIVGWIVNHATKNFWRVADWYELDDLIQDGLMVAYKCRERYGEKLDPPHFMALVKTAFYRHIAELLRHSRLEEDITSLAGDLAGTWETETAYLDKHAEPVEGDFDFVALLSEMPKSLQKAVVAVLTKHPRIQLDGMNESLAHWLKRVANFPLRFDFEETLKAYLAKSAAA